MRISLVVTVAALVAARDSLRAQSLSVMAQAIPVVTRAEPTATRTTLTEGYLSQPAVMAHGSAQWFQVRATLNLEGLTLERGELSTGGYGEGYVDRRHPHAYAHELLGGAEGERWGFRGSVFAGRGFAPFGSDDPMSRPFEKFPVNHHLAQVLERVVAIVAVRRGPVIGELGTFNGDEPTGPSASPAFGRFGDSWSARLTVLPFPGAEVSGSFASVASPEVRVAQGLDQRKVSAVARLSQESPSSWRYAFVEYAHTQERTGTDVATSLSSILGEGAYCKRGAVLAARFERTERPEEEQLLDPFRTPRPGTDFGNLGISRWTSLTVSLSAPAARISIGLARPFLEIARVAVSRGSPAGIFSPELRYGATRMWMISGGMRLRVGAMHDRMGRYGVALPDMKMMQHGTPSASAESVMMPDMSHPTSGSSAASMMGHGASSECTL